MKKQLILGTVLALSGLSAFGQGYFLFGANKNTVWDAFTTQGVSVSGGGNTRVGFIWGPAATVGNLGASGNPTNNVGSVPPSKWTELLSDSNFHFATNSTSGALASVQVNASGLAIGGISYLGGATFTVAGTTGGQTYTIYVIGWNNAFADPFAAAAAGSQVGWSNPFQYASGATSGSPIQTFSTSGLTPFGVSQIPEPTTFALAGLGAAALMIFRRRK